MCIGAVDYQHVIFLSRLAAFSPAGILTGTFNEVVGRFYQVKIPCRFAEALNINYYGM